MRALLLTVLLAGPAAAAPGHTSMDFTHIVLSPRAASMGDAGVALGDDLLSALDLNPASLALLRYPEAAFAYNRWFDGIQMHHAAYGRPFGKWGAAALSGTWLIIDPIPGYDNSGAPADNVHAGDVRLQGAYGVRLFGPEDVRFGLFTGVGAQYVRESLGPVTASSQLMEAGFLERLAFGESALGIGLSFQGIGKGLRFDQERDPAPTEERLGASWTTPVLNDPLSLVAEARKPAFGAVTLGGGVEYVTRRVLAVRLGWTSDSDLGAGFRFGAGINLKFVRIDYAVGQFAGFGLTHRIAVSTRFGEPMGASLPVRETAEATAQIHINRGNHLIEKRRLYEAALEFNEALVVDPLNPEARSKLRYVRDLMETQSR
ncbi:MAG: PorV/PorQ family protein [Elusimicrobia bacterium]|nr:PorV/PorQ family protein [Elusimicrobiota bacterium]